MRVALNVLSARWPVSAWFAMTSRKVSATMRAAWNMDGTPSSDGARSSGVLLRSSSRLTTACVVARLPAVISVIDRSPGVSQIAIFRKVEILSSPAFVRVSDMNTSPRSSIIPTQYVIRVVLLLNHIDRDRLGFPHAADARADYRRCLGIVQPRRDAHIACIRGNPVRHVESDPAQPIDMRLGPGVHRLLCGAVVQHQVARHVAGRIPQFARAAQEDMGVVLTHAP